MPNTKLKRRPAKLAPVKFPPKQHPRILRRAKELKQSPEEYIQSLVEVDLANAVLFRQKAGSLPKFEDFLPKSDADVSDQEMVDLVKEARGLVKTGKSRAEKNRSR